MCENELKMDIKRKIKTFFDKEKQKINCNVCPDSTRLALINFDGEKFSKIEQESNDFERRIVFILESPHKEEFDKYGKAIAPAQGQTGRRFEESLINTLVLLNYHYSIFEKGVYGIYIINAIQYQISLGIETKEYRSVLFQVLWYEFAKDEFKHRINEIIANNKDCVFINSCTKGNSLKVGNARKLLNYLNLKKTIDTNSKKIDLSSLVSKALNECGIHNTCNTTHPIQWNNIIK